MNRMTLMPTNGRESGPLACESGLEDYSHWYNIRAKNRKTIPREKGESRKELKEPSHSHCHGIYWGAIDYEVDL